MRILKQYAIAASFFILSAFQGDLKGCTGIMLTAKDQSIVHGRTLEFGVEIDTSVVVIPRGYAFKGTIPGGTGMDYKAKYAATGAIAFDKLSIMDGMNEKGLAVGIFYFAGFASYGEITPENKSKALAPDEFANWILTQFATVDEVKAALPNVVIAPTVVKTWGPVPPPFHYIVYDKSGKCLVIEPLKGTLVSYDNPIGILTNSPTFDWHLKNLHNYVNLTAINAKPITFRGMEIAPFGQGSGMVGLPGDFTPPSRFVRATVFCITALPSENAFESVFQAFHILNQFDIPVGAARQVIDNVVHTDFTMVTCVRDPQALKYYYRTYKDQTIRMIDLSKFNFDAKEVKKLDTKATDKKYDQQFVDATTQLQQS